MGRTQTEATKQKIAASRAKYTGENHPRFGAVWDDEQRAKYTLTMHQRREEEKKLKMFLILYNQQWEEFKQKQ